MQGTTEPNETGVGMEHWISEAHRVCEAAASGDLEARILNIDPASELAPTLHAINHLLDMTDAFVREASASLSYACEKKFFRRVLPAGLLGSFKTASNTLNDATHQMSVEHEAKIETHRSVSETSGDIDSGTKQIASASQQVAEGAFKQAASLEQITASLMELTEMTKQNAESSGTASELSKESQELATRGQREMTQLSEAMNEIRSSSDEIAKIIKVIDGIAFQTNMLALNAAVEAARAGDSGKGFAVVAEEVRSLARRSAEAAKSTSEIIEVSMERAEKGVAITGGVSTVLEDISTSTSQVNSLLSQIATGSKEHAEGLAQISQGVSEVDTVTQQNAGNAQELAAYAKETSEQVGTLRATIDQLNPGKSDTHEDEPAPHRAAA
ncbi:MAG: methyl-accepting chemotaxis protein [Phycisphaerales bacterium]|jgi:methyl-accepting chemotaxis protein